MIEYQTPHAEAAASRVMRVEDAVAHVSSMENGGGQPQIIDRCVRFDPKAKRARSIDRCQIR